MPPSELEVWVGYCEDHGAFYFVGPMNGYCPVMVEKWGRIMRCNGSPRYAHPRTFEYVARGLGDALAILQEHHVDVG